MQRCSQILNRAHQDIICTVQNGIFGIKDKHYTSGGKQICFWILVLMCLCLPRLPWPTFPFSYTHRIDMDAIKKKMQSMKVEKDNAMDRADVCEQAAKDAKVFFLEESG